MSGPALARATPLGRFYEHPVTGRKVISVTTAIRVLDKPALPRWAAKAAAEYADSKWETLAALGGAERIQLIKGAPWRESEKAANLGTAVHEAIDAWCTDRQMPDWEPGVEAFMLQFAEFLEAREPRFVCNEATVWSETHGYAGTLDWIAEINGVMTLGDTKSGKGVYPEVALQLEALRRADYILGKDGTESPIPDVTQLAVLHVRPRSWALIPVDPGAGTFDAFVATLRLSTWLAETAPTVLGARLKAAS